MRRWSRREVAETLARVMRRGLAHVVGRGYALTVAGKTAVKKLCGDPRLPGQAHVRRRGL